MWGIEQLSHEQIGQWYFVLGYFMVLISHNWPLLLSIGLCLWWGIRLYRHPSQARVCWFFGALLLGLAYEYQKHIEPTLRESLEMVLFLEAGWVSRPVYLLIGPLARVLLFAALVFFLGRAFWLDYGGVLRAEGGQATDHPVQFKASSDGFVKGSGYERE